MPEIEAVWHNDGHQITVTLEHANINTKLTRCPNKGKSGTDCYHEDANGCIVEYFIDLFDLECNVGTAPAAPDMPIAWAVVGSTKDLDKAQVWIIPADDAAFASWLAEQTMEE